MSKNHKGNRRSSDEARPLTKLTWEVNIPHGPDTGEVITVSGTRMVLDGVSVTIYDEDGEVFAAPAARYVLRKDQPSANDRRLLDSIGRLESGGGAEHELADPEADSGYDDDPRKRGTADAVRTT